MNTNPQNIQHRSANRHQPNPSCWWPRWPRWPVATTAKKILMLGWDSGCWTWFSIPTRLLESTPKFNGNKAQLLYGFRPTYIAEILGANSSFDFILVAVCVCIYIYIHMKIYVYIYINMESRRYIYIYIERIYLYR